MKVDIIIPIYKSNLTFLDASLKSCIEQTYKDINIVAVVDGCDLDYSTIFNKYGIVPIVLDKNYGPGYARNFAIKNSSSEIISFLDSDDIMLKDKIAKAVALFKSKKEVDLTCGNYKLIINGKANKTFFNGKLSIDYNKMLKINYVASGSTSIRRSVFEKITNDRGYFFDERYRIAEDYSAWLEIARIGAEKNISNIVFDTEPLYLYRISNDGSSLYFNKENRDKEAEILSIIKSESRERMAEFENKKEKN